MTTATRRRSGLRAREAVDELGRGAAQAATTIGAIASLAVVLGIAIELADLNRDREIVDVPARFAAYLAGPFDLFRLDSSKAQVAVNYGIAAFVWLALGLVAALVIRRLTALSPRAFSARSVPKAASTVIALAGILVAADIGIAVLLVDFDARPDNGIVNTVLDISRFLIRPFSGIFSNDNFKLQVTVNALIGAAVYAAAGLGLARVVRLFAR